MERRQGRAASERSSTERLRSGCIFLFRCTQFRFLKGNLLPALQDGLITAEWLRKWGLDRWESLLHYMVASVADGQEMKRPEENWQPSKKVKEILVIKNRDGRGLMQNEKITEAGFSFLLRPLRIQVVPYAVFDRVEDPC